MHPIKHVGNVPLSMEDGKEKYMADVLHVPTITKNLVFVGQMVEQGLQVRFNEQGCFVKDFRNKCRLVAKGRKDVYTQCEHAKSRYGHVCTKSRDYCRCKYVAQANWACKSAKAESYANTRSCYKTSNV